MPLRALVCFAFVLCFSLYAWRNWFVSLCVAIVLMSVLQHPDMPKNILDIQGLNPWNILIANVVMAWLCKRRQEGLIWDMPGGVKVGFFIYAGCMAVATLRMLADPTEALGPSMTPLISEYVLNTFKWFIPGILLYDACRTRERAVIAMVVITALYLLLALQVILHVPLRYAATAQFNHAAYKLVESSVGYNRVTMSMMLGGGSWAAIALLPLFETKWRRRMVFGAAFAVALGQALTGGRSGYVSWAIVGLILCIVRWRRLLPLIPVAIIAVCIFMPAVRDRMLMGLTSSDAGNQQVDAYEATSGRNIAWPYVIDYIEKNPIVGYGRQAMMRAGVYQKIMADTEDTESFPHPHNAYLESLLDSGIIGFFCTVPFFLMILSKGFSLFLDKEAPICSAAGGMVCALVLALLVGSMGGQTFYPREGAVGMWAAVGLMLRVYVERIRARQWGTAIFDDGAEGADAPSGEGAEESSETEAEEMPQGWRSPQTVEWETCLA
jgi:O-antigen ligase